MSVINITGKQDKETVISNQESSIENSIDWSFHGTYERMRKNPNNFSNWWKHLSAIPEDEMQLFLPKTKIFEVPENVAEAFYMDKPSDYDTIRKWVESIMPQVQKTGFVPMFIKNGTFSDKYYFQANCLPPDPLRLAASIQRINYSALCVDAGGITELVIREAIPVDKDRVPCIYGGLPLRTEFRVFYDFDRHTVLYTENYWDWKTCSEAICRDATDRIIYSSQYGHILSTFERLKKKVEEMAAHDLNSVTGLTGVWSVDVLLEEAEVFVGETKELFWLIDMARGEQSTYYSAERVIAAQKDFDIRHNNKLVK